MLEELNKEEIAKNSFWNLSTSLIAKAGSLLFSILLARILLPEKFGIYSIAFTLITILLTVFDCGINQTLVKFISERRKGRKLSAYSKYVYLVKLKFIFSFIAAVFLLASAWPISQYVFENSEMFLPLVFSSLCLFLLAIESFYMHLFYAFKKFRQLTLKEVLSQLLRIIILLVLFAFVESEYYVVSALASISIISLISIIYLIRLKGKIFGKAEFEEGGSERRKLLNFAFFVGLSNIANSLLFYIDSLILSLFVTPDYVGYYKAAFSLVLGVSGIGIAPVLVLLPYLTNMKSNDQAKITRLYLKTIALFSIPASFGLAILGKNLVLLFFGNEYLYSQYPLMILAFTIFPQIVVSSIFFNMFAANNRPRLFLKQIIRTNCLNILLNVLLIYFFVKESELAAMIAVAIAGLVSWIFYFYSSYYAIKKEVNISLHVGEIVKPILASVLMALAILFSLHYVGEVTLFWSIVEIALGVVVYFLGLWLLGFFKSEEFKFLKRIFENKKQIRKDL